MHLRAVNFRSSNFPESQMHLLGAKTVLLAHCNSQKRRITRALATEKQSAQTLANRILETPSQMLCSFCACSDEFREENGC
jgi:hypothetical protein